MTVPPPHVALASPATMWIEPHRLQRLWSLVVVHNHGNANAFGGLPFRIGGDALENV